LFPKRRTELQILRIHVNGRVAIDGGQSLGEQRLVAMLFEVFPELALQFGGVGQQILDAAVLRDQFARGFLADAGYAWDIVRGVAPQADDVADLFRFSTPTFPGFQEGEGSRRRPHAPGLVDEGPFRDELSEVFVRSRHVGFEALLFGASDERADNVVGFVTIANQHRDVEGFEQLSTWGKAQAMSSGMASRWILYSGNSRCRWVGASVSKATAMCVGS